MAGPIWAIGEVADGTVTKVSTEVATLARILADAAGRDAGGVVVGPDPSAAATELAGYVPRVLAVAEPAVADHAVAAIVASRIAALVEREQPDYLIVPGTPDGRDIAGILSGLLGWGVLANAAAVRWDAEAGPVVEMHVFGGKLVTESAFTGGRGIITVPPNAIAAEKAAGAGSVDAIDAAGGPDLPLVEVVERTAEAGAAVALEDARVVVAGGRGVGGADGFALLEDLADALGGVVGSTRAAVDAGWIGYATQIGQTGKSVRPRLYVAAGVSGAIQHRVGMQGAGTIVAINRDADAPIAEVADVLVAGDLFEIVPAITRALRERSS